MNILFVSRYYPGNLSSRCADISKIGLDWAAHNLCTAIIKGFYDNGVAITVLNVPQMGSFPAFSRSPIVPGWSKDNTKSLPYYNMAYLKRIDTKRRVLHEARQWCLGAIGEKVILFYNFDFLGIMPELKREFPDVKAVLIVTDLPEFFNPHPSFWVRINEMISPVENIKNEQRLSCVDGFILLAPAMINRLPINGRPWIVVEGIYNDEAPLIKVEKSPHKVIMYAGNLGERYGIRNLLDAFSHIKSSDYRLWIRGNGGLEPLVRECAKADKRIVLLERMTRKELMLLQQKATLMINPVLASQNFTSYFFPSKILEFMASGTPTMMSHLACMPKEYDKYLFYFNSEDSEDIANQITQICSMPQDRLNDFGGKASEFIINNKAPKEQIAKVLHFLSEILSA